MRKSLIEPQRMILLASGTGEAAFGKERLETDRGVRAQSQQTQPVRLAVGMSLWAPLCLSGTLGSGKSRGRREQLATRDQP